MAVISPARMALAIKPKPVKQPDDFMQSGTDRPGAFVPNPKTNPGADGKQARLNKQRPAKGQSSYS